MSFPPQDPSQASLPGSDVGAGLEQVRGLAVLASDQASSAGPLVREASGALLDWLALRPDETDWDDLAESLEWGLAEFTRAQGWRGPVAGWLHTIESLVEGGRQGRYPAAARETLAEELGLWLGGAGAGEVAWDGKPLSSGRRLPDRASCGTHLLEGLERGEVICVYGYSETVALALEEGGRRNLAPEVLVSEGGPNLGGRRMARRLNQAGLPVRYVYDSALPAFLERADRLWMGTEAIGAASFLGLTGCTLLCSQATRLGVPTAILATSDKLLPGAGELAPPGWGEEATWQLWGDAPEGVRVEPQAYEVVSTDLPDVFVSEHGPSTAADFSLRCLRTAEHA